MEKSNPAFKAHGFLPKTDLNIFESPGFHDNRMYSYDGHEVSMRPEYLQILDMIPSGSTAIDLGCGNGSLLALLREKGCTGIGVELSPSGVEHARKKGLQVTHGRIDECRPEYQDHQFDFGICNVTLQMVMYPEVLLRELFRFSKFQIVSFPNFAFIRNRIDLLFNGRMPRQQLYGYSWYSTGHIHQLSFRDFEEFCASNNHEVLEFQGVGYEGRSIKKVLKKHWPNLFLRSGIFLTRKRQ